MHIYNAFLQNLRYNANINLKIVDKHNTLSDGIKILNTNSYTKNVDTFKDTI